MLYGGSEWSGWPAYLSFFRHVAKLELPEYDRFQHFETAAHYGARFMHPRFCIVSDRSQYIHQDAQHRPHATDGPYRAWRDGWRLYYVHGVRVPESVVMHPEQITASAVLAERNAEVRRIMLDRMGHERFVQESGAQVVHRDARGELFRVDVPDDEPVVAVRVVNSTPEPDGHFKEYTLRVPPTMRTATEAVAWTFGLEAVQYHPMQES